VKKKAQSKRVTLKNKYKVQKKVADHHRKIRKEARKNPQFRKHLKKDPGVPNLWPMKQDLLKHLQQEKRETFENGKKQQEEKKRKRTEEEKITELQLSVIKKTKQFEEKTKLETDDAVSSTVKDASKKTFFREFKKLIKMSDVILEVLDARDPLGSRSPTIEKQILSLDPNKKIILVLNKIDLIPRQNVIQWLSFLRDEFPTIAFKSTTQKQKKQLGRNKAQATKVNNASAENTCLGAETLIQLLKNYSRSFNIKKTISVGIIGFPNVGKSSLINSLKRHRAVNVGARPGVTRSLAEVSLDKDITLIDCPGIIFASDMSESDAALRNCINFQQIENCVLPVQAILNRCSRDRLTQIYKIPIFETPTEFLQHVATRRGRLGRGGVPDIEAAAQLVLNDWNTGRIPYYTVPPESDFTQNRLEATIVSQWSEAFKLSDIMELEQNTVMNELGENPKLVFAATVPSQPLTPHDAFMRLDRPDDDTLEDIQDPDPIPKKNNKKKSGGTVAIAPSKEKNEATPKKPKKSMSDVEKSLNPTINKETKKRNKEEKKIERKVEQFQINHGLIQVPLTDTKIDAEYNFGEDFWGNPLPEKASTVNEEKKGEESDLLDEVNAFEF